MKALTVHQPWASAIAAGSKLVETRSWRTKYRGHLLIHAARTKVPFSITRTEAETWYAVFGASLGVEQFPFGALVAIAQVTGCERTQDLDPFLLDRQRSVVRGARAVHWTERKLGNFERGRWGWLLADVRALPEPIPFRGRQGLFEVPDALLPIAFRSSAPPRAAAQVSP